MPKLFLTIVSGGVLLGALLGKMADPSMKSAPQPDWQDRYRASYPDISMQFVDSGAMNLGPPSDSTYMRYGEQAYFGPSFHLYERPPELAYSGNEDTAVTDGTASYPADSALELGKTSAEAAITAARLAEHEEANSKLKPLVSQNSFEGIHSGNSLFRVDIR